MQTFEFVSPKHPDKMCDQIADAILDKYLEKDPDARVAIEIMGGHGKVTISGEVTCKENAILNQEEIEKIVYNVSGENNKTNVLISRQSPEIAMGVDRGGAGDQGIMIGYATSETETFMPKGYEITRQLCRDIYKEYPNDGKVQVTFDNEKILSVVASFQKSTIKDLEELVRSLIDAEKYFINPAGEWNMGGFDADSGLTGRKIVIDSYGPEIPVGGGSFSGKDATKVDRSGAYMARKIAVDLLKQKNAKKVLVKLAYVIGVAEPVMTVANIDGSTEEIKGYDLSPAGIMKTLDLKKPIYFKTSKWGHFGRNFPWDK